MVFKLFSSLFKKSVVPPSCKPLSDESPITEPKTGKFGLWHHQKAMLNRCLLIEEFNKTLKLMPSNADRYRSADRPTPVDVCVGIMNDPPGCGKTHVMLSLMVHDANPTVNIVVVPPNLHNQWVEAVKSYLPLEKLPYKTMTEYSQVANLFNREAAFKMFKGIRLIITTTMFIDAVAGGLEAAGIEVDRVIVDEIDTASSNFHNVPKCKRVWFMSASFDPANNRKMGPFDLTGMTTEEIGGLICRCETAFMQKHQGSLEEPETELIKISDGDIELLLGVVGEQDIKQLNAMNIGAVKNRLLINREKKINNVYDLAKAYLVQLEDLEKSLLDRIATYEDENDLDNFDLNQEIADLKQRLNDTRDKIDVLSVRLEKSEATIDAKKLEIERVIEKIKTDEKGKYLFFSDDDAIYDIIEPMMKDVKYVTLSGGTLEKNEKALAKYKGDPETKALLLNSTKDGCGLNLENTTHIVFLHYTNPQMVEQVIGRAQRPGRKNRLNIICLYYENEVPKPT